MTNNKNEINDVYCRNCGEQLKIEVEHKGYCRECGSKKYKVWFVCPNYNSLWDILFHHDRLTLPTLIEGYKGLVYCSECEIKFLERLIGENERISL